MRIASAAPGPGCAAIAAITAVATRSLLDRSNAAHPPQTTHAAGGPVTPNAAFSSGHIHAEVIGDNIDACEIFKAQSGSNTPIAGRTSRPTGAAITASATCAARMQRAGAAVASQAAVQAARTAAAATTTVSSQNGVGAVTIQRLGQSGIVQVDAIGLATQCAAATGATRTA